MAYELFIGWSGDRATGHAPADSTTYFFSNFNGLGPGLTTSTTARPIALAGTLTGATVQITVGGTLGSNETFTVNLRLNNTTDTVLTSVATADAASNTFVVTGLSVALAQGDLVEIKFLTPAWVTNPTAVVYAVTLHID